MFFILWNSWSVKFPKLHNHKFFFLRIIHDHKLHGHKSREHAQGPIGPERTRTRAAFFLRKTATRHLQGILLLPQSSSSTGLPMQAQNEPLTFSQQAPATAPPTSPPPPAQAVRRRFAPEVAPPNPLRPPAGKPRRLTASPSPLRLGFCFASGGLLVLVSKR